MQNMTERAYELADMWAHDRVECLAAKGDEIGVCWGFRDDAGNDVTSIDEAAPDLRGAVEWLVDRGQAQTQEEPGGECFMILSALESIYDPPSWG